MEKSKYAWIVAASANYIPGLKAFFNSAQHFGHKEDVLLCSFNLPQDFLDSLKALTFNVRIINMKGEDQVLGTAIERFRIAYELGKEYEAICLLDADIFLTANNGLYFDIAAAGFIVAGANGMIIDFDAAYQKQYELDLGKPRWPYAKVHTTAPIFLSPKDLDWFSALYNSRRINSFDDFLYLNILGIKMEKYKRLLVMPPMTFTGIHHFGVKPETGWFEKAGLLLTGTEEQCYMIHGKWWDKGWVTDLPKVMKGYFKDNSMSGRSYEKMENSIKTGQAWFDKFTNMKL